MQNWDDVRVFLALVRARSIGGAARALHVHHSTVARRLAALEAELDAPLFLRRHGQYTLTAAGQDVLHAAEEIEALTAGIALARTGRDRALGGTIRLATPDGMATMVGVPLVAAFRAAQPAVHVQIITSNASLDLAANEADVEIRPTLAPDAALRGRRIARIAFGLYASAEHGPSRLTGPVESWAPRHDWVMPAYDTYSPGKWLRALLPPQRIVATSTSVLVVRALAQQGVGLTALPCFLADPVPGLKRLALLDEKLWGELWLLTHPRAARGARIRAFFDFTARHLRQNRAAFEGRLST